MEIMVKHEADVKMYYWYLGEKSVYDPIICTLLSPYSCCYTDTLQEHQSFRTFAIYQKFLTLPL